jgi:hypothetical protein
MFKKFIVVLLLVISSSVFARAGGVTNIKEVVNRSSKVVKISTYENKALIENGWKNLLTTPEIAAGGRWTGDMWIPWADNSEQFKAHFMKIEIIEKRPAERTDLVRIFAAYQTGEEVRASYNRTVEMRGSTDANWFNAMSYNPDAPKVDGEWKSGGERRVIFFDKPDGSGVGFKFEKFTR